MARRALDGLATAQNQLGPETQHLAEDLLARRSALEARLRSALSAAPGFAKTRHHGDYHLGQVLVAGDDAVIVDFEGEPLRPLAERRAKHAALRDVAGMLRSLAYAAAQAERTHRGEQFRAWKSEAARAYLDGYYDAAGGGIFLPTERTAADAVMRFFMLEKALYEVAYELANRPDWVNIPLRGVLAVLDAEGEVDPTRAPHAVRRRESRSAAGVRFRLWAPSHPEIGLELDGAEPMPMQSVGEGWHELVTDRARAGTRYSLCCRTGCACPIQPLATNRRTCTGRAK